MTRTMDREELFGARVCGFKQSFCMIGRHKGVYITMSYEHGDGVKFCRGINGPDEHGIVPRTPLYQMADKKTCRSMQGAEDATGLVGDDAFEVGKG